MFNLIRAFFFFDSMYYSMYVSNISRLGGVLKSLSMSLALGVFLNVFIILWLMPGPKKKSSRNTQPLEKYTSND
jgi:hypothetical protein